MYRGHLRDIYKTWENWKDYSEIYGLSKRLGFKTAISAWNSNPIIQGSANPDDYKIVNKTA